MAVRMTATEVVFRRPFVLRGFDRTEPAGTYKVETEEESIDDVSFPVWRRLATVMHVTRAGATEYVRVDPDDLRHALARDSAPAESPIAAEARLQAARRRGETRLARRRKF
jgi:hypothetical protein